jgi:nuclear inhibitor of protein phosphatase 1
MLGIPDDEKQKKKRKKLSVTFNEEDEVINPEDIDPSIGRFRNLVQSTVIPSSKKVSLAPWSQFCPSSHGFNTKASLVFQRPKLDHGLVPHPPVKHHYIQRVSMNLYDDLQPDHSVSTPFFTSLSTKLGLPVPSNEPKKKKYAKEAWPGKKHGIGSNLLV